MGKLKEAIKEYKNVLIVGVSADAVAAEPRRRRRCALVACTAWSMHTDAHSLSLDFNHLHHDRDRSTTSDPTRQVDSAHCGCCSCGLSLP